jgi:hypothetical protein
VDVGGAGGLKPALTEPWAQSDANFRQRRRPATESEFQHRFGNNPHAHW